MDPRLYSNRRRATTLNKDSYDRTVQKQLQEQQDLENKKKQALQETLYSGGLRGRERIAKERQAELIREHQEQSSLIGLTEALTLVVKKSLLLDESYLKEKAPTYESDIKETIRNFLEQGNVNRTFTDKDTRALCEAVARVIPVYQEGIMVEAAQIEYNLADTINNSKELNNALNSLSGDVAMRVATMVEENQNRSTEMYSEVANIKNVNEAYKKKAQQELDQVVETDENGNGTDADEIIAAIQAGEVRPEDLPALLQSGDINPETYDQVVQALGLGEEQQQGAEEMPAEGEEAPMEDPDAVPQEEMPAEGDPAQAQGMPSGKAIHIDPDGTTSIIMQNGQLSLNRDGSVDIQLAEAADSALMKQSQMANGWSMSKQGSYDPEMLLAKGLGAVKSTLGLDIATILLAASVVGLPAAYGTAIAKSIRHEKNLEKLNSEQYKELRDYAKNDPKVISILKKIKYELGEDKPSRETLKELNQELKVELKRVKAEHRETLKEQIESLREFDCAECYKISIQEAMNTINSKDFHNLTEDEKRICSAAYVSLYANLLEAAGTLEEVEDKINFEKVNEKDALMGWLFADKAGSVLLFNLKQKVNDNYDPEFTKKVCENKAAKALMDDIKEELEKEMPDVKKIEKLHKDFVDKCSEIETAEEKPAKKNDDVIENLAMNEGYKQLKEGKEFDADAAVANAIVYVTVLETLDRTGIVTIGKEGYNNILEACHKNRHRANVQTRSASARKLNEELTREATDDANRNMIKNILNNTLNSSFMNYKFSSPRPIREQKERISREEMYNRVAESNVNPNLNENYYFMNGRKYSEYEMNQFLYSQGFHNGLRENFEVLQNYFGIKKAN